MISLDPRAGSGELLAPLQQLGLPVQHSRLEFGDAAWSSCDGRQIAVERKRLGDLFSSIESGRFSGHQLPGLKAAYDRIYLLVEGVYRAGEEGRLEVPRRGGWEPVPSAAGDWKVGRLDAWYTTMEEEAGLLVRRTSGVGETCGLLRTLYSWWQRDDHHSHLQQHDPASKRPWSYTPPSAVELVAGQIPGLGWKRAKAVAAVFPTVECMVAADEKLWQEVDGVGKKLARTAVEWLR